MAQAQQETLQTSPPREWAEMAPEVREIYSSLVGIRKRLQYFKERSEPHTMDDLRHYQQMLDAIDSRRKDGIFGGSLQKGVIPPGQAACYEVMDEAYDILDELISTALPLEPSVLAVQAELTGIARRLARLRGSDYTFEDLRFYEQMVNAVDRARVDGIFCGSPQTRVPAGQAQCSELLSQCYALLEELKPSAQHTEKPLLEIYDRLLELRENLRVMKRTPEQFSVKEVKDVEGELDAIDEKKVDGVYGGSSHHVPSGQHVVQHIMSSCRKLVRQLKEYFARRLREAGEGEQK